MQRKVGGAGPSLALKRFSVSALSGASATPRKQPRLSCWMMARDHVDELVQLKPSILGQPTAGPSPSTAASPAGTAETPPDPQLQSTRECMLVCAQSCPTLQIHGLWPTGSSFRGSLQARILEWGAMSSSRGSAQLRDLTHVSCIGRRILYQ